jgi:ubiquinone/menaquinone biosynthesis C-methylase UbiE
MASHERWNHNNHFHHFILQQLPAHVENSLDVGCGQGFFAAHLAAISDRVDAVDLDTDVIRRAIQLQSSCSNIHFINGDFTRLHLPEAHYDVLVSIACLHHMDLEAALIEMKRVLRPRGVLVILGLYHGVDLLELPLSALSIPLDFVQKRIIHRNEPETIAMNAPLHDPSQTIPQIKAAAARILPGARLQRHLYWRYSLIWHKPG